MSMLGFWARSREHIRIVLYIYFLRILLYKHNETGERIWNIGSGILAVGYDLIEADNGCPPGTNISSQVSYLIK